MKKNLVKKSEKDQLKKKALQVSLIKLLDKQPAAMHPAN